MVASVATQFTTAKLFACPRCDVDVEADLEVQISLGPPEGSPPDAQDVESFAFSVTPEVVGVSIAHKCGSAYAWPQERAAR